VIIPGGPSIEAHWREVEVAGKDIVCVQTKAGRLGMYLLGQAFFSRLLLLRKCGARTVRTVAVCNQDDDVLRPLAEEMGIEVVVVDPAEVVHDE
jgi:predicted RecB family endonuclease